MDFNERNLITALKGMAIGRPLYFLGETESTNTFAFGLADQGAPEGTVVIANSQTEGRGRLKRPWESPPDVNLYASVILKPDIAPSLAPCLTLMAGVAVADLVSSCCPGGVHLKWPNDVQVNKKKIAGILSEIKIVEKKIKFVILGLGININLRREAIPHPLKGIATSLLEETGIVWPRVEIVAHLFDNIARWYDVFLTEGFRDIRDRWLLYAPLEDTEVTCGTDKYRGRVTGIAETGALELTAADGGLLKVIAGDVSYVQG